MAPAQNRIGRFSYFQQRYTSGGSDHPGQFREERSELFEVTEGEPAGDAIYEPVGDWEAEGITLNKRDLGLRSGQHAEREIHADRPQPRAGQPLAEITGTARQVKDGCAVGQVEVSDGAFAPPDIHSKRHHAIDEVVAGGDCIEHRTHRGDLLIAGRERFDLDAGHARIVRRDEEISRLDCVSWLGGSVASPAMAPRTVILIPPSEGKAPGGNGTPWEPGDSAFPELDRDRAQVLKALGRAHPARTGPTSPAMKRYTGVLYQELDAGSLRGLAHRRLDRNVLVASGLWGLVAPTDSIPDYKLKMGARLEPLGRLSAWWRPRLTAALTQRVKGAVVWDLLPHEHAAAVHWPDLAPRTRVTVQFLDAGGRTVSHWNKLLKGSIVRWLVETGSTDPGALADLDHPQGYVLDEASSSFGPDLAELVLRQRS